MDGLQVVVDEVSKSVYLKKCHRLHFSFLFYCNTSLSYTISIQHLCVSDPLLFSRLQEYKILPLLDESP